MGDMVERGKRATIRDVAKRAGVSIGTVSNALNNAAGVGPAVRQHVVKMAEELGYHPNRAAQATRTGRTRTLAFVTPDLTNPFYPRLAQAITKAAREAGYAMLLVDTQDGQDEREGLEHIIHFGVDGVLWCPATASDVIAQSQLSVPVVVIDQWLPGRDNIAANYRMSGKLISDHILSRSYRSIGLVSGPQDIPAAKLRRDHLLNFLDNRVPVAWEVFNPFEMILTPQSLAAIARKEADVIVCCDDLMAIAALQAVQDMGLSVPDDVAIIGHDDLPIAAAVRPGITTVRQPLHALGQEAVHLLLERMNDSNRASRDLSIDVELIVRGSSC